MRAAARWKCSPANIRCEAVRRAQNVLFGFKHAAGGVAFGRAVMFRAKPADAFM
jgi:hypothetical protein